MTAALIVTIANAGVDAFSDGAAYDDDGVFREYAGKIDVVAHAPAIVFTIGNGRGGAYLRTHMGRFASFDSMVAEMGNMMRLAALYTYAAGEPINMGLTVAGFSAKVGEWRAYRTFARGTPAAMADGSFECCRLPWFHAEPAPSDEALAANGVDLSAWSFAPEEGIRFLQAQRDTDRRLGPKSEAVGCTVGGFVEHTTLTADGAVARVVHRWPDVIGRKLGETQ